MGLGPTKYHESRVQPRLFAFRRLRRAFNGASHAGESQEILDHHQIAAEIVGLGVQFPALLQGGPAPSDSSLSGLAAGG